MEPIVYEWSLFDVACLSDGDQHDRGHAADPAGEAGRPRPHLSDRGGPGIGHAIKTYRFWTIYCRVYVLFRHSEANIENVTK